jgi:ribosomal protein uS5
LFSLPVKEAEIIDYFLKDKLQDEVMKIMPVQKQSSAGQRTRFKAFVAVGDGNGHIGLGVKCSSEVANAIRGAITAAKLNVAPVRRGYWGRVSGLPHTVPCKVTGKCGSVSVRLIPAPRGTASRIATVVRPVTPVPWVISSWPFTLRSATRTDTFRPSCGRIVRSCLRPFRSTRTFCPRSKFIKRTLFSAANLLIRFGSTGITFSV